nr:hypothetical protein Iba_scaffold785CG0020 [Ipomoea batatas]GME06919.1 hypothetical protein Iba_scaffold5726CG0020 [Ipomoea batatas]
MLAECSMLARPDGVPVKSISKSVYGCPLAQSGDGSSDCPIQAHPGAWIGVLPGQVLAGLVVLLTYSGFVALLPIPCCGVFSLILLMTLGLIQFLHTLTQPVAIIF